MNASQRERLAPRMYGGNVDGGVRSPVLAQFYVDTEMRRKNERDPAAHELTDDEADAFGYSPMNLDS